MQQVSHSKHFAFFILAVLYLMTQIFVIFFRGCFDRLTHKPEHFDDVSNLPKHFDEVSNPLKRLDEVANLSKQSV